jgi:hypothetical protein
MGDEWIGGRPEIADLCLSVKTNYNKKCDEDSFNIFNSNHDYFILCLIIMDLLHLSGQ